VRQEEQRPVPRPGKKAKAAVRVRLRAVGQVDGSSPTDPQGKVGGADESHSRQLVEVVPDPGRLVAADRSGVEPGGPEEADGHEQRHENPPGRGQGRISSEPLAQVDSERDRQDTRRGKQRRDQVRRPKRKVSEHAESSDDQEQHPDDQPGFAEPAESRRRSPARAVGIGDEGMAEEDDEEHAEHDHHGQEERVEAVEDVVARRVADGARIEPEILVERLHPRPAEIERNAREQRGGRDDRRHTLEHLPVAGGSWSLGRMVVASFATGLLHAADRMPIRSANQPRSSSRAR